MHNHPLAALAAIPALVFAMPTLAADTNAPLPTDPALVTGTLDNGLSYIIRKHANPAGRSAAWIHIGTGSLNETESTRGIAHFLEHMAFNGSENFPPGTVVDYFQSIGLAFGRDQNAFTSFDQTTYQLYLPDTKIETIDRALLFFSDVATRLKLLPSEIEKERGIIQEERRTRLSPAQRTQEKIFQSIAPESTFGRRLPIGTEETINSISPEDFQNYYKTFYVPSNMTLIVVADTDPAPIVDAIKKQFGSLPKLPRPADLPVGVKPTTESRAIIATDPEIKQASIAINRVEPARPPSTTVSDLRRDLVELIGTWAFNRRIESELAKGGTAFLSAFAGGQSINQALVIHQASAAGEPEKWADMLTELATHIQRARIHGFTEEEIADARKALIAQAEQSVQREATLPARAVLARINSDVAAGEPVMSAQQNLDLFNKLLPAISADEVSRTFASNYDTQANLFVLTAPSSPNIPSESQLLDMGRKALSVKPDKLKTDARAASLMTSTPTPGTLADLTTHAASNVTSAWLPSGIRVHHRPMDIQKNTASIIITLAGGTIQETAETRGLTDAASLAWDRPATSKLSSTQIRDLMTGKKVAVSTSEGGGGPGPRGGGGSQDALRLVISGNPAELEAGFQLAHLLLTDPVIEPAALDQWKKAQKQAIEQRKNLPQGIIAELIADTFYPKDEARLHPLTAEQVDKVTLEAAQAWLRRLVATSPIEVAIVGDITLDQAKPLVETYLGSLPKRDRISDTTHDNLRKVARPSGPLVVEKKVDIQTPLGVVLDGFFATDAENIRDARLLQLASRIMSTRMIKTVREDKQLVYSISANSQPATTYPGFGLFLATAPTEPSKAPALAETLEEMYTAFAKDGPTEEELNTARKQMANMFDEQMKEPGFWTTRLATLNYRNTKLDDVMSAPEAMQSFTANDIREAFTRYYKPEARFRFTVIPSKNAG
jgi:zinc protease